MIEHHIQDDIDSVGMQRADEMLELGSFIIFLFFGGITGIGRKEADRIVSPVIDQLIFIDQPCVAHLIKFKDWHQFYSIDPQFFQIGNFFLQSPECAGTFDAGRGILRKSSDMEFVNDQILHGNLCVTAVSPVKVVVCDTGAVAVRSMIDTAPVALSGN